MMSTADSQESRINPSKAEMGNAITEEEHGRVARHCADEAIIYMYNKHRKG
jgi:hypothetical protein